MPTTKQRITVTVTGRLEEILEIEALQHPELSPSALVAMLVERGHSAHRARAELVRELAGGLNYPDGYLADLRSEWPD